MLSRYTSSNMALSNSQTILISLGGSLIINIIAVYLQHRLNRSSTASRATEQWYSKTTSKCNDVKRTCLQITPGVYIDRSTKEPLPEEPSDVDFSQLEHEIEELHSQAEEAPPEINDELVEGVRRIKYAFQNPQPRGERLSSSDVRQDIRDRVDQILWEIYERSEKVDSAPS